MMYSQGLKRVIAARSVAVQMLLGSTTRAVSVGLVNQNVQAFSLVNVESVSRVPISYDMQLLNYQIITHLRFVERILL